MIGYRSASVTRNRPSGPEAVEAEIVREKADALGRAGERLEQALSDLESVRGAIARIEDRLRECGDQVDGTPRPQRAHSDLVAHRAILRNRARMMYEYLLIQREAVGVRNHQDVERCYRVSERLR